MIFRGYSPGDELAQSSIRSAFVRMYPDSSERSPEAILAAISEPDPEAVAHIYADDGWGVRGVIGLRADGRVSVPECLPGYEHLAPELIRQALKLAASRGLLQVVAVLPTHWHLEASFVGAGFVRVREIVSFAQTAMELPTVVGRFSPRIQPISHADLSEIETSIVRASATGSLPAEFLECLHRVSTHSSQPPAILRRPDGTAMGVGWLVENDDWPPIEVADPFGCDLHVGTWGGEVRATVRVNGAFSFLAVSAFETVSVGLDLLARLVSEMNSVCIRTVCAQVPADASQLKSFYDRYFKRLATLSLFRCRVSP